MNNFDENLGNPVRFPEDIKSAPVEFVPRKRTGLKKFLLAIACVLLISAVLIYALKDDSTFTHSLENIIELEQGDYTHRIIDAHIKNNSIELEILYYRTDVGIGSFRPYYMPDYQMYYNGARLDTYTRGFGSAVNLGYKMPAVKQGKAITVSLYDGTTLIGDIELLPASDPVFTERPRATFGDITLIADVRTEGEQLRVTVSSVLPKNAAPNQYDYYRGFVVRDMYIQDTAGNIYKDNLTNANNDGSMDAALNNEKYYNYFSRLFLHIDHNIFYFDIPKDVGDLKIIVSRITYTSKKHILIERYGYWEIDVPSSKIIK